MRHPGRWRAKTSIIQDGTLLLGGAQARRLPGHALVFGTGYTLRGLRACPPVAAHDSTPLSARTDLRIWLLHLEAFPLPLLGGLLLIRRFVRNLPFS